MNVPFFLTYSQLFEWHQPDSIFLVKSNCLKNKTKPSKVTQNHFKFLPFLDQSAKGPHSYGGRNEVDAQNSSHGTDCSFPNTRHTLGTTISSVPWKGRNTSSCQIQNTQENINKPVPLRTKLWLMRQRTVSLNCCEEMKSLCLAFLLSWPPFLFFNVAIFLNYAKY